MMADARFPSKDNQLHSKPAPDIPKGQTFKEAMIGLRDRAVMYSADWSAVFAAHEADKQEAVRAARLDGERETILSYIDEFSRVHYPKDRATMLERLKGHLEMVDQAIALDQPTNGDTK